MAVQTSLLSQLSLWFSRLTEREKRLVILTGGVAVIIFLAISVTLAGNALEKREKRVNLRRTEIAQLDALRERYQEAVQSEERSKRRITSNTASLFTLLQKSAAEIGMPLSDLNEKRTPLKDSPDVTEVTVDLTLKEISVDKLATLIEKIEGRRNDGVVKITKLKVKTRFDNPEMLEVSMTVATWKASSSSSATAPMETP
jgi:general secretion pathway protein M